MRGSVMQAELARVVVGSPGRPPGVQGGELALEKGERPIDREVGDVGEIGVWNAKHIQEKQRRRLVEAAAAEQVIGGDHSDSRRIQRSTAPVRRIGPDQVRSTRLNRLEDIRPVLHYLWAHLREILSELVRCLTRAVDLCQSCECLVIADLHLRIEQIKRLAQITFLQETAPESAYVGGFKGEPALEFSAERQVETNGIRGFDLVVHAIGFEDRKSTRL